MIKMSNATKNRPHDLELPLLDVMRCAVSDHDVLLTEEDKLFESEPDKTGVRILETSCFHCSKKLRLETDPKDEEGYFVFEYDEK